MDSNYIKARIELLVRAAAFTRSDIKDFIKDTTRPLDDRWDIFCDASAAHILEYAPYIVHLPTLDKLKISWYDDFYVERYATVDWADIVNDRMPYGQHEEKFAPHIDQIKEEILARGQAGFTMDW